MLMNGDGTGVHKILDSGGKVIVLPKLVAGWQVHRFRDRRIFSNGQTVPGQLGVDPSRRVGPAHAD